MYRVKSPKAYPFLIGKVHMRTSVPEAGIKGRDK